MTNLELHRRACIGVFLTAALLAGCSEVQTAPPLECPQGQIAMDGVCVEMDVPDAEVPEPLSVELTDGLLSYLDFDPEDLSYSVDVRHLLPSLTLRVAPSDDVEVVWQSRDLALDANGEAVLDFFPGASDRLSITYEGDEYRITIERAASNALQQAAYLKAPAAVQREELGRVVAVSGDLAAVAGDERVVVFRRNGRDWSRETVIDRPQGAASGFGRSLAVDADTLLIGANGAAEVFTYEDGIWSREDELRPLAEDTTFGISVDLDADTAVVGALDDSQQVPASGAAYVFVRSGSTWRPEDVLKASNPGEGDFFGESVAIHGDVVVVGARGEDSAATGVDGLQGDDPSGADSGAAYVFLRAADAWSQEAYLKSPEVIAQGGFGRSVDVFGQTVIVGAPDGDDGHGEAHVYRGSGGSWSFAQSLKSPNPGGGDAFGRSVAIDRVTVVVGAGNEDSSVRGVREDPTDVFDDDVEDSGAAYLFIDASGTWAPQFYLKALNADGADLFGGKSNAFGKAVAIDGDTVVVGAPGEDSNAIDVGGEGGDNSVESSGAAYVFR